MVLFFSPLKKASALQISARGELASQLPPPGRRVIQWKLKAACSFPPSLSQRWEEKGVQPAPALSDFSPPPPCLRETPPFVILRSIIADKKHEIKIC